MDLWKQLRLIQQQLHEHPEPSFKEIWTTELIKKTLHQWGLPFHSFKTIQTGGYTEIGSGFPIFAFRADIDALPIRENPSHVVKSLNRDYMHACGHDFHTAIGLGIAKVLSDSVQNFSGRVRIIFQPAEEAAPGGAELVANELDWENVQAIIGLHVFPNIPVGKFILYEGPVQASSTSVKIELQGPGGHTSKPHETIDLISVAGQFIFQLQHFLQQKTDPRETVAFVFGSIHGGTTHNIIPESISLRGTLRTLNNQLLENSLKWIKEFAQNYAQLFQLQIKVEFPTNCPATINDPNLSKRFQNFMATQKIASWELAKEKPSLGADDFSFYLKKVPGLYLLIGGGGQGILHSSDLLLDPALIKPAVQTLSKFLMFLFKEKG